MSEHKNNTDQDFTHAHRWLDRAARELGVDESLIRPVVGDLLDLTRDVAHGPSRPAAPLTAFLVGVAAGSQDLSVEQRQEYVRKAAQNLRDIIAEDQDS